MKYIQSGKNGPRIYQVSALNIAPCPRCGGALFHNEQMDEAAFRDSKTGTTDMMVFCVCEKCGHILAIMSHTYSDLFLGRGGWVPSHEPGSPLETLRAMDEDMVRKIPVLYYIPYDEYLDRMVECLNTYGGAEPLTLNPCAGSGPDGKKAIKKRKEFPQMSVKGRLRGKYKRKNIPAGFRPRRV